MMRLFFLSILLFVSVKLAAADAMLITDGSDILFKNGDLSLRHSPCSTFKIPISLMGYNEGILIDEKTPEFPFKEGYTDSIPVWKQAHNPSMWMKNSCVWYSQVITSKLGIEKFQSYIKDFSYGNQDASGDRGKGNGLSNSWLGSSLQISPAEQVEFLQKLCDAKLPVDHHSVEMTKRIIYNGELQNGWQLYGKTGSGYLLSPDGTKDEHSAMGWFIGWIEKDGKRIFFASYIERQRSNGWGGPAARTAALTALAQFCR